MEGKNSIATKDAVNMNEKNFPETNDENFPKMDDEKLPKRCCVCPPSDLADHEIEILNSGLSDELDFEEETVPEEEEKIDLKKMHGELLCIKNFIERQQFKLKIFLEPCPDEPCIDFETELTCSPNEDICKLQRSKQKLECQIKELTDCCKTAKIEFKRLRSLLCSQKQEILDLQKQIAALESWRRGLELEAGLCIERFEYLKHVKAEWSDITQMLEKERDCYKITEQKLVTKDCYIKDKLYFLNEIRKLKQMFTELYELQHTKFEFHCAEDTPPKGSELDMAEKEYLDLKKKFIKLKEGVDEIVGDVSKACFN